MLSRKYWNSLTNGFCKMTTVLYVWDLPLRLFHWLLVLTLGASYVTGKQGGLWLDWHARFGLFIIALLVFRIVWGFNGSTYARFANFFPTPGRLKKFFSSAWSGIGHSPLGALAIFALLIVILAQAVSGLFAMEDESEFYGPLNGLVSSEWSERLTAWHARFIYALILLSALHVTAIAYYRIIKRKDLMTPMLSGRVVTASAYASAVVSGGGWLAFLLAMGIAALVAWLISSETLLRWFF